MSQPVKKLDVNNIKNNILSKGLAPDQIIAYFIIGFVGYIFLVISRRLGIPITNWVATIGFPMLAVWYVLYILKYENQPYYQLIAPFINFNSSGNHRKKIMASSYDIREPSILNNKPENAFIGLLRVFPKNIFTLTDSDRDNITQRFATDFLNNNRGKRFELLLRNRTATVADYKSYFDHFIDMPQSEFTMLSPQTVKDMQTHLLEVEQALNQGMMKYKELYLELHIYKVEDDKDNEFNIKSEMETMQNLLKAVNINSLWLNQLETEQYLAKFVLFKSTEEINMIEILEVEHSLLDTKIESVEVEKVPTNFDDKIQQKIIEQDIEGVMIVSEIEPEFITQKTGKEKYVNKFIVGKKSKTDSKAKAKVKV